MLNSIPFAFDSKVSPLFSAIEVLPYYVPANIRSLRFTFDDTKKIEEMHYEPKYMYICEQQ